MTKAARFEALEATVRQSNELLVKRVDHIAAEHSVLLAKVEKLGAAVLESHRSIPACPMDAVGSLPLCSEDSLAHFLQGFKSEKDYLQQTVDGLIKIGGRDEKDIIRSILSRILGPPLILQFTYSRAAKNKMSFIGKAVRQHPDLRTVDEKFVRNTIIEWFHGSRDRYGGVRGKRRDVVHGGFLELLNSEDTLI
ncbi:unnamed protein product [Dibothriocephalus latus]|uniref:DUF4806 domain-containing protein n=1 Tax=Dibothriocephalus latus TaxID=60516 RepID=A0A3P7MUN3_DIBLA|nr:unnamed protein product [Dibothriocephalus latus]